MSRRWIPVTILAAAVLAAPAWAEHHETGKKVPEAGGEAASGLDAFAKLAEPGEHHAHLDAMVGTWEIEGRLWMMPGQDPVPVRGTMTTRWILGGRFLESVYEGDFMGTPVEGRGIDGYDNTSRKYVGIWMDTLSTQMARFEGQCDGTGKVRTMYAEFHDPVAGRVVKTKGVTTILEDGGYRYESFRVDGDEEVMDMEMIARRK